MSTGRTLLLVAYLLGVRSGQIGAQTNPVADAFELKSSQVWTNESILPLAGPSNAVGSADSDSTNNVAELLKQGRAESAASNWSAAHDLLQRAIKVDSTNVYAYLYLSRTEYMLGRYPESLDSLRTALTLGATNAWIHYAMGCCYFMVADYRGAAATFEQYALADPTNAEAHYWLSRSYAAQRAYRQAESAARTAIALNATTAIYFAQWGYCLEVRNRYREALAAYQRALALDPEESYCEYHSGICHFWLREYREAAPKFEHYLAKTTDEFDALWYLGHTRVRLAQFDRAADAFKQALELKPRDRAMRRVLLLCYLITGQTREAANLYPVVYTLGAGVLLVFYLAGLGLLLAVSFRASVRSAPGFWFSVGWLVIFFEGQLALAVVLGATALFRGPVLALAGLGAACVPLIFVAGTAFPRQPWGGAFAWPRPFPPLKIMALSLVGLIGVFLFEHAYSKVIEWVTHKPFPVQPTVPYILDALRTNAITVLGCVVLAAPIAEEILFRGLLFGALLKRVSPASTIVITAALFAAIHLQAMYFLPIFLVGLLLGWSRYKTGSLWASAVVHVLNNGFSLVLLRFFPESN
jgi:membrane protease YdiL (CAAX protease family)/Tfp pilus assembly protein PilF